MIISNINSCLNNTGTDEKAGVKLARLTGDEKTSVFAIEVGKEQSIPAHYHQEGIETYFILDGQGIVQTGALENGKVHWITEKQVIAGDCFAIYPDEVHSFKNSSEKTLRILGTSPLSHTNEDRYFIA
ncbi:MAG: cupin domain-containing protein [Terrimonas sp.]|nr:cupin domain-containing protein [Terrimonas sp.]